jgi:hypothetical protein
MNDLLFFLIIGLIMLSIFGFTLSNFIWYLIGGLIGIAILGLIESFKGK